jgi:hypothetical protein
MPGIQAPRQEAAKTAGHGARGRGESDGELSLPMPLKEGWKLTRRTPRGATRPTEDAVWGHTAQRKRRVGARRPDQGPVQEMVRVGQWR